MGDEHPARRLPEADRLEYLAIVASVAYSDRVIYESEADRILDIGRDLGLGDAAVRAFVEDIGPDVQRSHEVAARFRDDKDLATRLLTDVILVAFADGMVQSSEAVEVAQFAKALGISTGQATMLGRYVESVLLASEDADVGELSRSLAVGMTTVPPNPYGIRRLYKALTK